MWESGNLDIDGVQYIYEILVSEKPSQNNIWHGRIQELYLYDADDHLVAEYKKSRWSIEPKQETAPYKAVGILLREQKKRKKGQMIA